MFFDVVIKVLNFIVSVIRVELPKITLHLLLFCKCRFVDVSCSCRPFSICFLYFYNFFSGNIFNCSEEFFCQLLLCIGDQG